MKNILVVCEANICRSPMAQGLLGAALPHIGVRSAGLSTILGAPVDETSVALMRDRGIDISSHRAAQITRALCLEAELVLVMSTDQRKRLEERYPFACGRAFRIGEFSKRDIPDPYRQSQGAFRKSFELIEESVREWLLRIRKI